MKGYLWLHKRRWDVAISNDLWWEHLRRDYDLIGWWWEGKMSESLCAKKLMIAVRALAFYADRLNWRVDEFECSKIRNDSSPAAPRATDEEYYSANNWHGGQTARIALSEIDKLVVDSLPEYKKDEK